jgi:prolyl-tRNA editing enzyme YbaK/EbsC (Cys-tRNA(Pro) deacylase)
VIPPRVQEILAAHNLQAVEFEENSTPTAPLAAAKLGVTVGQIAKSMLFVSKQKRFYLVVCPGDRKVSSSKLKALAGEKTRMAGPEETLAVTGFPPGGVCPFGLRKIPLYLDRRLLDYPLVYPAAGNAASGVPVNPHELAKITGAEFHDLTQD